MGKVVISSLSKYQVIYINSIDTFVTIPRVFRQVVNTKYSNITKTLSIHRTYLLVVYWEKVKDNFIKNLIVFPSIM